MMTEFEALTEQLGAGYSALLFGAVVGLLFGFFAQQSKFCLRSAVKEFFNGRLSNMLPIWLLAFSVTFLMTQLLMLNGMIEKSQISYLNVAGSLSGALIGGAMFGVGMILTRGCVSRLLVLSATGNTRALLTFVLIALIAEESINGVLSSYRSQISNLWTIAPEVRDMSLYIPSGTGIVIGVLFVIAAFYFAFRRGVNGWSFITAVGVGFSIGLGWILTGLHASVSFDIIPVQSLSFIAPSVDTVKLLKEFGNFKPEFDSGIVPGVFLGSLIAALLTRQFKFEFFTSDSGFGRYVVGALLMGFGGVLAVGCSIGAGVTGVSVLSLTAFGSLIMMVIFAGIADRIFDQRR